MREFETHPYSADEARVAKYFADRGIGGGDDPIGAMLVGYAWVVEHMNKYRAALEAIAREQSAPTALISKTSCPNIKNTYEGYDGERWRCEVCGESFFLDYDDMQ